MSVFTLKALVFCFVHSLQCLWHTFLEITIQTSTNCHECLILINIIWMRFLILATCKCHTGPNQANKIFILKLIFVSGKNLFIESVVWEFTCLLSTDHGYDQIFGLLPWTRCCKADWRRGKYLISIITLIEQKSHKHYLCCPGFAQIVFGMNTHRIQRKN